MSSSPGDPPAEAPGTGSPAGGVAIRLAQARDLADLRTFLTDHGLDRVARRGQLLVPIEHPALLALDGLVILGVLTFVVDGRGAECEVLTLHTGAQWRGIGTALLQAVEQQAARRGCTRLRVVTTNDNVDALRFYQRRGFRLVELRPGAVDESRSRLKPEIPETGDHGIPLRDELELEKRLTPPGGPPEHRR